MICIFGPTAVGKTGLVYELFRAFPNLEIINADSVQVYKELAIGSAHPTPELMAMVPHHLVNVLEPTERFSSARFVAETKACVDEVLSRGGLPVVIGGTAFYIKQLVWGGNTAPPASEQTRAILDKKLETEGLASLYEELKVVDPERAAALPAADAYRIRRALEIYMETGRPASSWPKTEMGQTQHTLIGLTRPRAVLVERIAKRVDQMFEEGLVEEVSGLIDRYGVDIPALGAIGYKEFVLRYKELQGASQAFSAKDYDEIKEQIIIHTRQFAKRQMTFFKSFPSVQWIDPSSPEGIKSVIESLKKAQF